MYLFSQCKFLNSGLHFLWEALHTELTADGLAQGCMQWKIRSSLQCFMERGSLWWDLLLASRITGSTETHEAVQWQPAFGICDFIKQVIPYRYICMFIQSSCTCVTGLVGLVSDVTSVCFSEGKWNSWLLGMEMWKFPWKLHSDADQQHSGTPAMWWSFSEILMTECLWFSISM